MFLSLAVGVTFQNGFLLTRDRIFLITILGTLILP